MTLNRIHGAPARTRGRESRETLAGLFRRVDSSVEITGRAPTDLENSRAAQLHDPGGGIVDVFVSYAREDLDFIEQLVADLAERGKRCWIDLRDIPPTATWLEEILASIEAADSFVCVLSPEWAASEICALECQHAVSRGKRIVPVLRRDVVPEGLPEEIRARNWVSLRKVDGQAEGFAALLRAIELDSERLREHTRLLLRAIEWDGAGRGSAGLLRGRDLEAAERFLGERESGREPVSTALQWNLVRESRSAARRRRRILVATSATLLVAAAVIVSFAALQAREAGDRERTARSRELASAALDALNSDPLHALRTSVSAATTAPTQEAADALRRALLGSQGHAVLRGHTAAVTAVDYGANGVVASASLDGSARVWSARSGREISQLTGHQGPVRTVALSANAAVVATGDKDGTARTFEAPTGRLLAAVEHQGPVRAVAFAGASGRVVAAWDRGPALVFDAVSGNVTARLRSSNRQLDALALAADGRRAAAVASGRVLVWALNSGRQLSSIADRDGAVRSLALSADGRLLLTGGVRTGVRLWETTSGDRLAKLDDRAGSVTSVAFSDDATLAVASRLDGTTRVWDVRASGGSISLHSGRGYVARALPETDNEAVLTAGEDGVGRLWELPSGRLLATLRGHTGPITDADVDPGGRFAVTASDDRTIRVWRTATPLVNALRTGARVARVAFLDAPGPPIVTVGGIGVLSWNADSGEPTRVLTDSESWSADLSADRRRLVTFGARAQVWDMATGDHVATLPDDSVTTASISRDGRAIVTGGGITPVGRLWNLEALESSRLRGHRMFLYTVAFAPNGRRVATASADRTVRVWDASTSETHSVLRGARVPALALAWSPDSQLVAAGDGRVVRVWDADSGQQLSVLRGHEGLFEGTGEDVRDTIRAIAFSPNGRLLATGSDDRTGRIWDVGSGRALSVLRGHGAPVVSVRWSTGGGFVATGASALHLPGDDESGDGAVRVWEGSTGRLVARFGGFGAGVSDVDWSADGRLLAGAGDDGQARIFACEVCMPLQELIALARERLEHAD